MTDTPTPERQAGQRGLILDDRPSGVLLSDHLTDEGLEVPTAPYDYAKIVKAQGGFPMACNNLLGNCTIAGLVHLLQLIYAVMGMKFAYPGDAAVTAYYWKLVGHGPQSEDDPGPGLMMLTVIDDILAHGAFGTKIVAYGELDISDWEGIKTAAFNFGGVYLAVNLPQSAETDFNEHKIWTPSGSPIGGHCITGSGDSQLEVYGAVEDEAVAKTEALVDTETWGDETAFTEPWWKKYGAQAFVLLPELFVTMGHGPLKNVKLATLEAACHEATAARVG